MDAAWKHLGGVWILGAFPFIYGVFLCQEWVHFLGSLNPENHP